MKNNVDYHRKWRKNNPDYYKNWRETNPLKVKQHREKHKEKQAAYYRKWYAEYGRKRAKNYIEIIRLWEKLNPEKCKVHDIIKYALKTGKIKKPKYCSKCGEDRKLNAHHDNYEFPFKIRWLCHSCHKKFNHKN